MSVFPDFLYGLTPRDEQVTPLEIVTQVTGDTTLSATTFQTTTDFYTVPTSRILILKSFMVTGIAGATQTFNLGSGFVNAPNSSQVINIGIGVPPSGGTSVQMVQNDLYLGPGTRIFAQGTFSAATNPNTLRYAIHGILIPRGSFAI